MVCGTPVQGRYSAASNMWAVVVLGIITAVFAWVWFGGRGEKKASETKAEHVSRTAERVRGTGSEPETCERQASPLTALTSQESITGVYETSPVDAQPEDTTANKAEHTAGEASCVNFGERADGLYRDQELNPIESKVDETHSQDNISGSIDEQITQMEPLEGQAVVQKSRDEYQFTAKGKEVGQVTEHILKASDVANKELLLTKAEVHPTTCSKKEEIQTNEDLSSSVVTDKELVDAREEVYLSVGEEGVQVIVQHLKASVVEERLVQTSEEVPISAKTMADFVQPGNAQDGFKLMNGSEAHVQKENATVILKGHCTNGDGTASLKQVNKLASSNNFDHEKLESYNQSEQDFAVSIRQSSTMESTPCMKVNDHISQTNNVLTKTSDVEVSLPKKLDATLTSQTNATVEKCIFPLHLSTQEEEIPDLIESRSGDSSCIVTRPEAKLHDGDFQRTKRIAAVQPISQNVSLGFKVHYITHSNSQMIAIIGDHEKLGEWENYVPLTCDKDGYWSQSVTLPADANIEWKFIMVESGKIKRWEECNNRHLRTAHEDLATHQWWGYP